jgi:hypothetical protein
MMGVGGLVAVLALVSIVRNHLTAIASVVGIE